MLPFGENALATFAQLTAAVLLVVLSFLLGLLQRRDRRALRSLSPADLGGSRPFFDYERGIAARRAGR